MAEPKTAPSTRPELDILSDAKNLIASYPPTMHDRHYIDVKLNDGVLIVSGHVMSGVTRQELIKRLQTVRGIEKLDVRHLYDDGTVRINVSKLLPAGVSMTVRYGAVTMLGTLPETTSEEELVKQISAVPGVTRIVTQFA